MPPWECPSGSEGQTCGENFAGIRSGFYWLKSGKKYIDNICPPGSARAVARARPVGKILPEFVPVFIGLKVEKKIY